MYTDINIRPLIVALISSFLVMFAISYAWHGVLLNDFYKLYLHTSPSLSKPVFYIILTSWYLLISAGMTMLIYLLREINTNPILKGVLLGAVVGFVLQLIFYSAGLTFYHNPSTHQIMVDMIWQIAEQSTGGWIIARFFYPANQGSGALA